MCYSILRSFTTLTTVISIFLLIHSCVRATSDDHSINKFTNTHDNSLDNLTNVETSQLEKYPKSPAGYSSLQYNNLFMTMIINSLAIELKNLVNDINQVNKNIIVLNHQLESTNNGGDYSRVKRQAKKEIRKSKEIPIKKIINHKNFKRNIISYLKHLFNDNENSESLETSEISGTIAKDYYSTTACHSEDDTTIEENIATSKTSSLLESSTQPLSSATPEITSSSTLEETICETEEITSSVVINTDEITTIPTPITQTKTQVKNNIIDDKFENTAASTSTTCYDDTEIETTESSVNTNKPLVDDYINDNNEDDDDSDNSSEDCVNPIVRSSSRKLLEKLMNIKPLVKRVDKINSTMPLMIRGRNLQTNHIKLIKNLKVIKRETSLLSNMNNLKLGEFNEMKKRFKKHMKIGRTLKSYEFIEPDNQLLLPTIEGDEYDYDNGDNSDIRVEYDNTREIIDEALTPIAEGLSENLNTTDKLMNEKLLNFNRNNSNNLNDKFNETNRYCKSCICDIEYALMSLKGVLEIRSELSNRISQYSCDKFIQIGKYLDLTSASLSQRRAVDDTLSDDSTHQTLIKINDEILKYIQCDDAEDLLSIDKVYSNEHETLYTTESSYLINIPCSNDNKMSLIMSKSQPNYTWIRHNGGPISGIIRDNGDLELYQVGRALNVGNYSCIMTYIDSDDKKLIQNIYEHTVKSVILPEYMIRGVNHYKLDNFDEFKLEKLITYLKHMFNDILCKNILCDAIIFTPQYNNRNISIKILIMPSKILHSIYPAVTSVCDVKCHKAIQNKIILLLINNFRVILQKPIIFRLSNHRHGRLVPIKKDKNAELKVEQKQRINDDANGDIGLLVGCAVGYRLESTYCEPCPSGFYSQDLSWHCQECPLGTYQLKTGAKTCEKCTNPFVNNCFFMIWSSLIITFIILGLLLIVFLIGVITFWPICCKKRNRKYKMYREFSDVEDEYLTVPLIPFKINSNNSHDDNSICCNSCEQNDIEEDSSNKKKLLIYGINLLPTRRMMKH
ncbi:hypothetical protein PV327_009497 [Microctonus hyperodae]|uniref:Ig-like domain-containing protein n=1 Tax=Microctonus hyperodae TaxID=165561 RepID=A0AA39FU63_MICHY|nr:hypothetical protein PV327_009497 [Microctonus hyperodae]